MTLESCCEIRELNADTRAQAHIHTDLIHISHIVPMLCEGLGARITE